jgi:hypothetical protein
MRRFISAALLSCIFIFGLAYAEQERGSVLLSESVLHEIYVKLDKISDVLGKKATQEKEILLKLEEILQGQAEIKNELEMIRVRTFR